MRPPSQIATRGNGFAGHDATPVGAEGTAQIPVDTSL